MKRVALASLIVLLLLVMAALIAGSLLTAPSRRAIGKPPEDLAAEPVEFMSESGSRIHGWFVPGRSQRGVIVLLHGVRACRLDMLDRARFLSEAGYAVLLFDFQAHGESAGKLITFGYLESKDVQAALSFVKSRAPGQKIGVIGVSMGGAAAMLAEPPIAVDALVLEQVYPMLHEAIADRISMRLGDWSRVLTPLLSWQLEPRLGVAEKTLRPIDHARNIAVPKLFVGGSADRHTTVAELQAMFQAAREPKELWIVPGAQHVDLSRFARTDYKKRILEFFAQYVGAGG